MTTIDLTKEPSEIRFRSSPAKGIKEPDTGVVRDGGDHGAGLIRGFAAITRGEALGHGMWIDGAMLSQVSQAIDESAAVGIKSRFTHPDMSSDGMGKLLGRAKTSQIDGDVVRADLHFLKSAHETPEGDLAAYVMQLADEDPESFGTSIVFDRDREAERKFQSAHLVEVEERDYDGNAVKRLRFRSPDPKNTQNLPHVRLKKLRAVDVVDDPAANPGGLFHSNQIPVEAEKLLSFSLGLTDQAPELSAFDVDPARVASYVARFMQRNNLELTKKEPPMPEANQNAELATLKAENESLKKQIEERGNTEKDAAVAKAELQRRAEISALCKLANVSDKERDLMLEAGFSRAEAQDYLKQSGRLSAANPPVSEGGNDPTAKKPTKEEQFGKEWDDSRDIYERQGVSRDAYIKSRMIDK